MLTRAMAALLVLAGAGASPALAANTSFSQLQRGRYLTIAGDCAACHTAPGGKAFAGGRGVPTPFGTIYSANITPDRTTGIGAWNEDQFYRAMHKGLAADGHNLYPAMPYPNFTQATRRDIDDIFAYLKTIDPVRSRPPANELPWPLSIRLAMSPWNWLFFTPATFQPDPHRSAEWNRGAYLVGGLGHCGACHTAKNFLGADSGPHLAGGDVQNWFASDITGNARHGLGDWSKDDIVTFLATGRNRYNAASGPMSDVIVDSTSKMTHDDLMAMATYLKSVGTGSGDDTGGNSGGSVIAKVERFLGTGGASAASDASMASGKAIYVDQCAACHREDGTGLPGMFPPLKGSANVQASSPTSVLHVILVGGRSVATAARPTPVAMPPFGWKLSNQEIAAVADYVRNAWGNRASSVSRGTVANLRATLAQPSAAAD